jgi:hypothetical protein
MRTKVLPNLGNFHRFPRSRLARDPDLLSVAPLCHRDAITPDTTPLSLGAAESLARRDARVIYHSVLVCRS